MRQGNSRQAVFDTLAEKYHFEKTVADIVKHLPSAQAIEKYGKWNKLLLGLFIFETVLLLWLGKEINLVLWMGFLIYAVNTMQVQYYMFISLISGFGIMFFVAMLIINEQDSINWLRIIAMAPIVIPTLILPIWLEKRLCPQPKESKEMYTNSQGQKRLRVVYEFVDI